MGVAGLGAVAVGMVFPAAAAAHEPASTLLLVTPGDGAVELEAFVPLDRLEIAVGTELTDGPSAAVQRQRAALVDLFEAKVALRSPDGRAWALAVDSLGVTALDGVDNLDARLTATSPDGADADNFELRYEIVTDHIYTHKVYVSGSREDVGEGDPAELLGKIDHYHPTLDVGSGGTSIPLAFRSMVGVGIEHFRDGVDHLLFVVLVALGAASRRVGLGATVRTLGVLTLAFTLGHSMSLTLASLGWVSVPTRVVETAIAATLLVSAVHVVRPLAPMRVEPVIALAFGLVHGFGFAGTLGDLSVQGLRIIVPTFAFNVGLEVAQLAALALVTVPLWALARSRRACSVLATVIGTVAIAWIVERALATPNPLEPAVALVASTPERLALVLAVAAAARYSTSRPATEDTQP